MVSQTLNLNHIPIIYIYNNYMEKCAFLFINSFSSNLKCYNTIKIRH
jgi:hypothetical protein